MQAGAATLAITQQPVDATSGNSGYAANDELQYRRR